MKGGTVRRRSSTPEDNGGPDARFSCFGRVRAPRFELVDGMRDGRFVHFSDFEPLADVAQEGDVQFAAEVLPEFAKALDNGGTAARSLLPQRPIPEPESNSFQQAKDPFGNDSSQVSFFYRIDDVECQADGDRLAVAKTMLGHRLELVSRPVTEVERPRATQLERIAVATDMREVQFGGPADQRREDRQVAVGNVLDVRFEIAIEARIPQQGDFHRFRDAADAVAMAEGFQKPRIVDDRERRNERADEVLLAKEIDAVLDGEP